MSKEDVPKEFASISYGITPFSQRKLDEIPKFLAWIACKLKKKQIVSASKHSDELNIRLIHLHWSKQRISFYGNIRIRILTSEIQKQMSGKEFERRQNRGILWIIIFFKCNTKLTILTKSMKTLLSRSDLLVT